MRIAIASHIVVDTLTFDSKPPSQSLGGPAFYCGLVARKYKFDVSLLTAAGSDLPSGAFALLSELGLSKEEIRIADMPSTRFSIHETPDGRAMTLLAKCPPIEPNQIQDVDADCWLVSPVADEVPVRTLEAIKAKSRGTMLMLDPQGYLRNIDGDTGRISLADTVDLRLDCVSAIKVDEHELAALSGGMAGLEGMLLLQSKGIEYVVATEEQVIKLLHRNMLYWIRLGAIETSDTTGAGDILASSFACSLLKERDPLWAICFGAGAVRSALEAKKVGLDKVPSMSKIEQSASYFYNAVKFQQV